MKSEYSQLLEASGRGGEELKKANTHLREAQKRAVELEETVRTLESRVASQDVPGSNFAQLLESKEIEIINLKAALAETQRHCVQLQNEKQLETMAKVTTF